MSSNQSSPLSELPVTSFDKSVAQRCNNVQLLDVPEDADTLAALPSKLLRDELPKLPELSELQTVRHFTNLSTKNFSIDSLMYPLGSCTMKYNPRGAHKAALLPGFANRHPLAPESLSQGFLSCLYDFQNILKDVSGMKGVSLTPMAGAQGEFAGIAMIKAYHEARNDTERTEILIAAAAHGTNPASAVMCGYQVREVPITEEGDLDIDALKAMVGPQTAGLMMTNPSTCGIFDRGILLVSSIVHEAGGLLYYDGANLNAILGRVRPGDMGFDVMHMNLHKTFSTPHGAGGPGSGPVVVGKRLLPYLPTPIVICEGEGKAKVYRWSTNIDIPDTIGKLSTFMGNAGILLRAYSYSLTLGSSGLRRVSTYATLNANYVARRLEAIGFTLAYPTRMATHECIITMKKQADEYGVTATDFAKRILEHGIHAPTIYFPLMIPECSLIEPTETESKEQLDRYVEVMKAMLEEAKVNPERLKKAPLELSIGRLDEVLAAKQLDVAQ